MKTTIAAVSLSLFSTILAVPAVQTSEPNRYTASVSNLSLKHLIESDTYDSIFHANRRSPTGAPIESVICHMAWNQNGPYPDASSPKYQGGPYEGRLGTLIPSVGRRMVESFIFPCKAAYDRDGFMG
ncbi:hypothetical protein BJX64DRAFT_293695 [Aspergillus heterothallicus]